MVVEDKTKEELITELVELRKRIAELQRSETDCQKAVELWQRARNELESFVQEHTTELAKVNEELRKANRALTALSECNQALLQATDGSKFLNDVCRIIVEIAGYRLTWVGYAEQDEEKTIRPVAQYGYEEGYLETLNITWSDTDDGRGPTGTAIRTGKPCISRNIVTDPNFIPWRDEAIRRGYASSIALPLNTHGHTFGSLNIYAAEPDAFDAREVKLITQLADYLAYGIVTLHTYSEHQRAKDALQCSEDYFRDLAEKSFVGIYIMQDGTLKYMNPRAVKILGHEEWEILECLNIKDLIHPDDWKNVEDIIFKLTSGEIGSAHYQVRTITKNRDTIYVEVYGSRTSYQGQPAIIGTMLDITRSKLLEKALQMSEQKYRLMIEQSNDMIWALDIEGNFTFTNKCYEKRSHYTSEFLQGKNFNQFINEEYMPWVIEAFRRAQEGEPQHHEIEIRTQDGEMLTLSVNTVPILVNHEIVGTVSFGRDITEQKHVEEALKNALLEKETILNNLSESVVFQDSENRILWANRASADSVGLQAKELVGRHCYELWHQRSDPCEGCPVVKSRETCKSQEGEIISPDGQIWLIRGYPICDDNSANSGVIEITVNITEQKKVEEELKTKARLLDGATDMIMLYDFEGNFVYLNEAACKTYGYSRDEMMGINLHALVTQEYAELIGPRMNTIKEIGIANFEAVNVRKDGSLMPVEVHARIIESGNRELILSVAHDITERKHAQEQLKSSLEALRKTLRQTIQVVALTVETRDPYTAGHQRRVAHLAQAMAAEMGLSQDQIEGIQMAGIIHDIGKLSVPGEILSKPAHINDIELALVKNHPQVGYDILKTIEFPWPIAQMILQHHERMDGSGYPSGISGEAILLEARILAVSDVVEAMASYRPYRPALGIDEALKEISNKKGSLYDTGVVDACLRLFNEKGFHLE